MIDSKGVLDMERTFKKDQVIFSQGDSGSTMYVIKSGKIAIRLNNGKPGEKTLVELEAPKYFGEMAILEAKPRSASAVVLEDAVVDEIDKEEFQTLIASHPEVAYEIMANLSARLRSVTSELFEACKAIAESLDEQGEEAVPKKEGLLAKLKRYAKAYNDSLEQATPDCYDDYVQTMLYANYTGIRYFL